MLLRGDQRRPPAAAPRVCFVLPPGEPYGPASGAVAAVVRGLTDALTGLSVPVDIVAAPRPPYYESGTVHPHWTGRVGDALLYRAALPVERLAPRDYPAYSAYLTAVLPTARRLPTPDVVIVHNDLRAARWLRRLFRRAVILLWVHNEMRSALRTFDAAYAPVDRVIAVSAYIGGWLSRAHGLEPSRIRVIHNGVDPARFHPGAADPCEEVRVVCHGRVEPAKGYDLAAAAVRRLRERGRPVRLTVAGPEKAWAVDQATLARFTSELRRELGVSGGSYLGAVPPDEVPDLLRRHQIAVVPSRGNEAFGLSALEAMASGCATIVSDRGGLPELAGDGATVVPPDASAIEAAIDRLVTGRERLERARRAAVRRSAGFTWARAADQLLACVEDVRGAEVASR